MKQTPESTADYLDRHMIEAMKELAKERFNPNKKQTMKQTAVEWLWNTLGDKGYFKKLPVSEFKEAKAMEKEQIKDAWIATDNELQRLAAEQYYNETYNNDPARTDTEVPQDL